MSLLDKIRSGPQIMPRRVVIYGTGGIGKSTWAAKAPKPIFIDTEGGLGNIDCDSFPTCRFFGDVRKQFITLTKDKHEYQTLVIDSIDWMESLIWQDVAAGHKSKVEDVSEIPFGRGYNKAAQILDRFLRALDLLRKIGMHVILIAHGHVVKFETPEEKTYDRYGLKLHKSAAALVTEWADDVLLAKYKVITTTRDESFGRQRVVGVPTEPERTLCTSESATWTAKNRLNGIPAEIPFTWDDYFKYWPNGGKNDSKATDIVNNPGVE